MAGNREERDYSAVLGVARDADLKTLSRFGGEGRGDLKLRLAVEVPRELSDAERVLYEKLARLRTKASR